MRSNTQSAALPTAEKFNASISSILEEAAKEEIQGSIMSIVVPDQVQASDLAVASPIYKSLENNTFDTIILVTPSHTSSFKRIGVSNAPSYTSPVGTFKVNTDVCHELCDEDDDIFLENTSLYHNLEQNVQLPYLSCVLDKFDIVPVVMGVDSPEFCFELGHAIGEIMFNHRALLVATADLHDLATEELASFKDALEAGHVESLMSQLNSSMHPINGKGALLVALIASMHRRANRFKAVPDPLGQGFTGAIFYKS